MLKLDPKVIKGMAWGMGIKMTPLSRSLFMSREDFMRLKRRIESRKLAETTAARLSTISETSAGPKEFDRST